SRTREKISNALSGRMEISGFEVGFCISSSLRRHDPDQVLWVGARPLSPAGVSAGHPIEIAGQSYEAAAHVARGGRAGLDRCLCPGPSAAPSGLNMRCDISWGQIPK